MSEKIVPFPNSTPENINTNKINAARNYEELYDALYSIGDIEGSSETFTPVALVDKIQRVVSGEISTDYITKTYGLRDKVTELMNKHEEALSSEKDFNIETPDEVSEVPEVLEEAEEKIKTAKDFKELISTIIELGEIQSVSGTYSASEIVNEINELLTARAELQAKGMRLDYENNILMTRFTRSLGLRDKIIELLNQAA